MAKRTPRRDVGSDGASRFLKAVALCGQGGAGTDLFAVVAATGLSWAKASALADRLRRGGWLARLPHGRLILSERGRAAVGPA